MVEVCLMTDVKDDVHLTVPRIISRDTSTCMSFKKTVDEVCICCFFCIFNTIIVNIGSIFVQMYCLCLNLQWNAGDQ